METVQLEVDFLWLIYQTCLLHVKREFCSIKLTFRNLYTLFSHVKKEDVTKSENRERGTGNRSAWERIYRGNPQEKSKWLTKPSKEIEFNCDMKARFLRLVSLFAVIGLLAFILILPIGCHWEKYFWVSIRSRSTFLE